MSTQEGSLEGRVAIVTGGARNLGADIARTLLGRGASVVVGDLLESLGQELADSLADRCRFRVLDVTRADDWAATVAEAQEQFGRLDILVNNAGLIRHAPLATETAESIDQVLAVNVRGPLLGIQAATPAMVTAGGGSIVNVSSAQGVTGMEAMTVYTASKFAVRGLTRAAALELGRSGIRINAVCPGGIDVVKERPGAVSGRLPVPPGIPLDRLGGTAEIAAAVAYLASDAASYITGTELVVDGAWTAGFMFEELVRAT